MSLKDEDGSHDGTTAASVRGLLGTEIRPRRTWILGGLKLSDEGTMHDTRHDSHAAKASLLWAANVMTPPLTCISKEFQVSYEWKATSRACVKGKVLEIEKKRNSPPDAH
jgi:hypothetical protein